MSRPYRACACALLVAMLSVAAPARADGDTSAGSADSKPFSPHVVGDARAMFLFRADDNYFHHAETFRYSIPVAAAGVLLTAGAEILPRLSLVAEGFYVGDGADRGDARLRLTSGAILGVARFSFLRFEQEDGKLLTDLTLTGGFGRYLLRETYVDPGLSPQVFTTDGGSFGGFGGLEAAVTISGFRSVIGYGYHVAPAAVADRIGGSVYAGGHELSLGIGVRL